MLQLLVCRLKSLISAFSWIQDFQNLSRIDKVMAIQRFFNLSTCFFDFFFFSFLFCHNFISLIWLHDRDSEFWFRMLTSYGIWIKMLNERLVDHLLHFNSNKAFLVYFLNIFSYTFFFPFTVWFHLWTFHMVLWYKFLEQVWNAYLIWDLNQNVERTSGGPSTSCWFK